MFSPRRRELLWALGGLTASGCSVTPTLQLAAQALAAGSAYPVTRSQIEASPYAKISARLGDAPRAVMVLSRYDGDDHHWVSANRALLVTRHGRLVQTVGLERDLRHTRHPADDPLPAGLHRLGGRAGPFRKYLDVAPYDFEVPVDFEYRPEGNDEIEILERRHATLRVREQIRVEAWNWRTTNFYWVDAATGMVWKSRQRYCPDVAALEIEVLKPPA